MLTTTQYRPKEIYLFADPKFRGPVVPITVKAGAGICEAGQLMAIETATGKWKKYDDTHSDGTEVARAILDRYVDASGSADICDAKISLGAGTWFKEDQLVGLDEAAKVDLGARSYSFLGALFVGGIVPVGDLQVAENASVGGALTVVESVTAADLIATDDLTVGDDASIGGDLAVTGNTTHTGTLTQTGLASFGNGIALNAPVTGTDAATNTVAATTSVHNVPSQSQAQELTLPAAATFGIGRLLVIRTVNANTHTITVEGAGAETVDGAANITYTTAAKRSVLQAITGGWITLF